MQRRIVPLPRPLMRVLNVDWQLNTRGQDAGTTLDGLPTSVNNAFPRFEGSPRVRLRREQILDWRAWRSAARGRQNMYRITMVDPLGFDWIAAAGSEATTGVPFSDGQVFSSGFGFAFTPYVQVTSAHAVGAASVEVDAALYGIVPRRGQIMSAEDWPFTVERVTPVSGTTYRLDVWPPLRAAVAEGAPVMHEGTGLFEAVEDTMGNPSYDINHISRPQLGFIEVLNR